MTDIGPPLKFIKNTLLLVFLFISFFPNEALSLPPTKQDSCYRLGCVIQFDSMSISIGARGSILAPYVPLKIENGLKILDIKEYDKENKFWGVKNDAAITAKDISEAILCRLQIFRDRFKNCPDEDTVFIGFSDPKDSKYLKVLREVCIKAGFKVIMNFNTLQEALIQAQWFVKEDPKLFKAEKQKNKDLILLVWENIDTIKEKDTTYTCLRYEKINILGNRFISRNWLFYIKNNYLGADGLMPSREIVGSVCLRNDTLYLIGKHNRYGESIGDFGKPIERRFIKYNIDHNMEEFWWEPEQSRFFLRKFLTNQ